MGCGASGPKAVVAPGAAAKATPTKATPTKAVPAKAAPPRAELSGGSSIDDPKVPSRDRGTKQVAVQPKALAKVALPVPNAKYKFEVIPDRYETLEEVAEALRMAGLESSNLVSARAQRVQRITPPQRAVPYCFAA